MPQYSLSITHLPRAVRKEIKEKDGGRGRYVHGETALVLKKLVCAAQRPTHAGLCQDIINQHVNGGSSAHKLCMEAASGFLPPRRSSGAGEGGLHIWKPSPNYATTHLVNRNLLLFLTYCKIFLGEHGTGGVHQRACPVLNEVQAI